MNEYFLHGKAFMENGGYKEISLVICAISASEAHEKSQDKVKDVIDGVVSAVFDVMTKMQYNHNNTTPPSTLICARWGFLLGAV